MVQLTNRCTQRWRRPFLRRRSPVGLRAHQGPYGVDVFGDNVRFLVDGLKVIQGVAVKFHTVFPNEDFVQVVLDLRPMSRAYSITSAVVVMFVSAPFMMMIRGVFCPQIKHALGGEAVALRQECNDGMTVHQRRRYRDGHGVDVNFRLDRHHVGPVMRRDFQNGFDGVDGPLFRISGIRCTTNHGALTVNEPQCSKSGTKGSGTARSCCRTPRAPRALRFCAWFADDV